MPRLGEMFPSKWLQASDVAQRPYRLRIARFALENIGDQEDKWVMYFERATKGMVLNRTNANTLEWLFGSDNTDDWIGKEIEVFAEQTQFRGKPVMGLRVRGVAQKQAAPPVPQQGPGEQAAARAREPMTEPPDDLDDEIPF